MAKRRVDLLMVEQGLVESRSLAQRLVMGGNVRAAGELVLKPSSMVEENANIDIDWGPAYVSRGGEKLAAAVESFEISPAGKVCADVGASTGGFTDCLLQHEARRVYAIDVGRGILHWKLRQDRRVVVMEGVNARFLQTLPERIDLATVDASFISLKILLPVMGKWFSGESSGAEGLNRGDLIALVKPQFEAGRQITSRGDGVIRDQAVHREVLKSLLEFCDQAGFAAAGLIRSPLLGPKGNVEFLLWLRILGGKEAPEAGMDREQKFIELFGSD